MAASFNRRQDLGIITVDQPNRRRLLLREQDKVRCEAVIAAAMEYCLRGLNIPQEPADAAVNIRRTLDGALPHDVISRILEDSYAL